MKEADVVLAIEKKHQQSSTPPSPVKHTSAPDRDREEPSDILGLTYADTKAQGSGSRQGQGQGPGQGVGQRRNKWENNMTVDRSSTNASDEAIRVSESAQMVAAKVARLQDEQRRLDQVLVVDKGSSSWSNRGNRDDHSHDDRGFNGYNDDNYDEEEELLCGDDHGKRAYARANRAISMLSNQSQVMIYEFTLSTVIPYHHITPCQHTI